MHLLPRLVVFVETLCESPPIRQEANDPIEDVSRVALALQINRTARDEVPVLVEADNVHEMLQRARHRCNHICQEEVPEPHLAERTNENVPKCLG